MTTSKSVIEELVRRSLRSGGWSYLDRPQASVEASCLAALAVSQERPDVADAAIRFLLLHQHKNGAWPAFEGDRESSWTSALSLITLTMFNDMSEARERALRWLVETCGKEGHWFWRWKFKTVDREVRFNPDKFGWPWEPGTCSWVIPTAFSVIAIQQFTVCNRSEASERRIRLGVEMLLDRACVGGGWNSGNSVVYGMPLRPHIEATAIALLALQDERHNEVVESSLVWLKEAVATIESASSLAWSILSLFTYQQSIRPLQDRLAALTMDDCTIRNNATLATVVLALNCGEMIHPFMVLR